ncbi:MAG TPA: hypothetical protein PLG15_05565 [Candidatus Gastranaerophilaceae bacterium]|nr:hypothetical protein [Candidatus Gastranaerophilaceae bacterium]
MPFVYRLQKILDFRIRKKEEQLLAVQKAQRVLAIAEENIRRNDAEIEEIKVNQRKADALLMEAFDKYLKHLWEKAQMLEQIRQDKEQKLREEIELLVECEKAVKVLEKHKERAKEAYLDEQKKAELKQLSEIGVQRHFQQKKQKDEEEEKELLRQIEQIERETLNEY